MNFSPAPDPAPNYNTDEVIRTISETQPHISQALTIKISSTTTPENQLHRTVLQDTPSFSVAHSSTEIKPTASEDPKVAIAASPTPPIIPIMDDTASRYHRRASIRLMRRAMSVQAPAFTQYQIQVDSGANVSVTNNESLLINFKHIKRHALSGVTADQPALFATGIGYLPWRAESGETILVKC
jgi:hypothetical protein